MPPLPPVRNDKLRVEWSESKSAGQVLQEVIQRRCEWGDVNVREYLAELVRPGFKAKIQYKQFIAKLLTDGVRHPNVLQIVVQAMGRVRDEFPEMMMPTAILESVPVEAGRGIEVILHNIADFLRFKKARSPNLTEDERDRNLHGVQTEILSRLERGIAAASGNAADIWMACFFDSVLEVYWAGRKNKFLQRKMASYATRSHDPVQPHTYDAQTLCYLAHRFAVRDSLSLESEETLPGLGEEQVPYQWNGDLFTALNKAASIPQLLQHLHAQTTFLGLKYAWPIPVFSAEQRRALNSSDEQVEQAGWLYATVELLERKIAETELICRTPGDLWTQQVCRMMSSHMSRTRFSDVQLLHDREGRKPAIGAALYTPPAAKGELLLSPIPVILKAQKVRTQFPAQTNGGVRVGAPHPLDATAMEALESIAQRVQARHEFYLAAVTVNRLLESEAHGGFARVLGTFDCDCSADHPFGAVWVCPDDSLENQSSWSYAVYEHIGKADAVRSTTLEELRLSQQTLLGFFAGMSKPQIAVELVNACLIAMLNLLAAKARFDFSHGDIHNKNLMLVETREEHEYSYTVKGHSVAIRSRYRPVFIDYGRSFGRLPQVGEALADCEPIGDPLGQWSKGRSAVQSSAVYDQKDMVRVLKDMMEICTGKDDTLRRLSARLDRLFNVNSKVVSTADGVADDSRRLAGDEPDKTAFEVFMTGEWSDLPEDIVLLCISALYPEAPLAGRAARPAPRQHLVPPEELLAQWKRMHELWEITVPVYTGQLWSRSEQRLHYPSEPGQEPHVTQEPIVPRLHKILRWFERTKTDHPFVPQWMRLRSQELVLHGLAASYTWVKALKYRSVTRRMRPQLWRRLRDALLTGVDAASEIGKLGTWYLTPTDPKEYVPGGEEVYYID